MCTRFIYESKDENKSFSYLFGYEKENPSYFYLKDVILKDIVFSNNNINQNTFETSYTANLELAKNTFLKHMENMEISDLENI